MQGRYEPVRYDVSIHPVAGGFNVVVTEDDEETVFLRRTFEEAQATAACLPTDVFEGDPVPWSVFYPGRLPDAA